ncbi:MAG TPA: carboxymuconolactone decarboxylase family protein [Xanthobacteraceae bacterium]|jgi:uncharacterized peroxidase-related enzyme|nr:carboxymuconolactone decarboxylase family protein [Xanthobacteraceae bacterium]
MRIAPIDPATAVGPVKVLLDGVRKRLGRLPMLMRVLAHSPAALAGYLGLSGALAKGALPVQLRERIGIAVAEANRCGCCLAAHMEYGRAAGLPDGELDAARDAGSVQPAAAAALRFARALLASGGHLAEADLANMRDAGFDDAAMVEIAAIVAVNAFSNTVNNLAGAIPDVVAPPREGA